MNSHHYLYVTRAVCTDKPTENYHPPLQLPSASLSFLAPFSPPASDLADVS